VSRENEAAAIFTASPAVILVLFLVGLLILSALAAALAKVWKLLPSLLALLGSMAVGVVLVMTVAALALSSTVRPTIPTPIVPTHSPSTHATAKTRCRGVVESVTWRDAKFLGDEAVLVNLAETVARLKKLATDLISHGYTNIRLTGTTADHGEISGQRQLAKARALVIKRLLVGLGISAGRITSVIGVGSDFSGHVDEYNPDGSWNETLAATNRLVIVTADSGRRACIQ
jgi:hypothetical protein